VNGSVRDYVRIRGEIHGRLRKIIRQRRTRRSYKIRVFSIVLSANQSANRPNRIRPQYKAQTYEKRSNNNGKCLNFPGLESPIDENNFFYCVGTHAT